jgi:abnormal spindle-like microcephaly-associated protein
MKGNRESFNNCRKAATTVQRFYRARLEMKQQRTKFETLKRAVIIVQRKLRANRLMRMTRILVLKLQTRIRGYRARRRFMEMQTPERLLLRKKHKAARSIQAAWRGHRERSKNSNLCFKGIVERLIKARKNVDPAQTLAVKLKTSIHFLKESYDSNLAISFLAKLEYMARTVPWILIDDAEFVSLFCYGLMGQAIRSEIDKQIIELCSCIILNLSRYKDTKEHAFQDYGLMTIAQMLLRWCDKDCGIFNTLCTLVWVFAHCENKRAVRVATLNVVNFINFAFSVFDR